MATKELIEKWSALLDHESTTIDLPVLDDDFDRAWIAELLEDCEKMCLASPNGKMLAAILVPTIRRDAKNILLTMHNEHWQYRNRNL